MTALAVIAVLIGVAAILAGLAYLWTVDAEALMFTIGLFTVVCSVVCLFTWGLAYLVSGS